MLQCCCYSLKSKKTYTKGITMKVNDEFTLGCFMAMQGMLAGDPMLAHSQFQLAEAVIGVVSALTNRLEQLRQEDVNQNPR